MIRLLLLLTFAVLSATGCVSERRGTPKENPAWRIGVTTRRDVVAQWGNPDFVKGDSWVWWDVDAIGGKFRAAYMLLGVTISNSRRSFSGYRLTFSPDGTLVSVEGYETVPGGGEWSLWPW